MATSFAYMNNPCLLYIYIDVGNKYIFGLLEERKNLWRGGREGMTDHIGKFWPVTAVGLVSCVSCVHVCLSVK